jgi:hypothetical protein
MEWHAQRRDPEMLSAGIVENIFKGQSNIRTLAKAARVRHPKGSAAQSLRYVAQGGGRRDSSLRSE